MESYNGILDTGPLLVAKNLDLLDKVKPKGNSRDFHLCHITLAD